MEGHQRRLYRPPRPYPEHCVPRKPENTSLLHAQRRPPPSFTPRHPQPDLIHRHSSARVPGFEPPKRYPVPSTVLPTRPSVFRSMRPPAHLQHVIPGNAALVHPHRTLRRSLPAEWETESARKVVRVCYRAPAPNSVHPPRLAPNSVHPPRPPPNSVHLPHPTPNSVHPPRPAPNSVHPPHPTSNSVHPPHPTPNSVHPPHPPPNSVHLPRPPPNSVHPPRLAPNSVHPPHPTPNSVHPPRPAPNSVHPPHSSPHPRAVRLPPVPVVAPRLSSPHKVVKIRYGDGLYPPPVNQPSDPVDCPPPTTSYRNQQYHIPLPTHRLSQKSGGESSTSDRADEVPEVITIESDGEGEEGSGGKDSLPPREEYVGSLPAYRESSPAVVPPYRDNSAGSLPIYRHRTSSSGSVPIYIGEEETVRPLPIYRNEASGSLPIYRNEASGPLPIYRNEASGRLPIFRGKTANGPLPIFREHCEESRGPLPMYRQDIPDTPPDYYEENSSSPPRDSRTRIRPLYMESSSKPAYQAEPGIVPSLSDISQIMKSIKDRGSGSSQPASAGMFSIADSYKSNWKLDSEADNSGASAETEVGPVRGFEYIGPCVVPISPTLEVDMSDPSIEPRGVVLLSRYLNQSQTLRSVLKYLSTRLREVPDPSYTKKKAIKVPKAEPGKASCKECFKFNLDPEEHARHIATDRHQLFSKSFQPRLSNSPPPYTMVWCSLCDDYFMLSYKGCTLLSHYDQPRHKKAAVLLGFFARFQRGQICFLGGHQVATLLMCCLADLRNTRVKMVPPKECQYKVDRKALDSYQRTYHQLMAKKLVDN